MMNETRRELARRILRARHCLIAGEVAKVKGDQYEYAQWEARFDDVWRSLPVAVRLPALLSKYILLPAERQIRREGILAQNGRYHL